MSFTNELQKFVAQLPVSVPSDDVDAFAAPLLVEAQKLEDRIAALEAKAGVAVGSST